MFRKDTSQLDNTITTHIIAYKDTIYKKTVYKNSIKNGKSKTDFMSIQIIK